MELALRADRCDDMCGDRFTPANRVHTFVGLSFQVNLFLRYAERSGQHLAHFREMGTELGPFKNHDRIHMLNAKMLLVEKAPRVLEKLQAVRVLPPRIAVRKVRADITESRRAEQRIAKSVSHDIAVRMTDRAFVKRNLDAANNQLAPV